jgi:cell wall-associated NlpC family hydrolase
MALPATPNALGAIKQAAGAKGLDWRPLASVAQYESGLNPRALGDGGHAFGLFQNNNAGGTITGDPNPQRFFNPLTSAQYATNAVSKLGLQGKTPEQQIHDIVYRYERPADPGKEYAAALQNYRQRFGGHSAATVAPLPAAALAASPAAAKPSLPALPQASLAPLQQQFTLGNAQNQRALDALGAISGQSVRAPSAPDFSQLVQSQQTQLQPATPHPTVTVPLKGKTPTHLDPQAQKAVDLAKHYLGTKYVFGAASPKAGFDCSGLLTYVWGKLGVTLPHNAAAQYQLGKKVGLDQLQAGDAVFFRNSEGIHHVGMALGNGQFIQAPHTGDVVKISNLSDPYYAQQFAGGRRYA